MHTYLTGKGIRVRACVWVAVVSMSVYLCGSDVVGLLRHEKTGKMCGRCMEGSWAVGGLVDGWWVTRLIAFNKNERIYLQFKLTNS